MTLPLKTSAFKIYIYRDAAILFSSFSNHYNKPEAGPTLPIIPLIKMLLEIGNVTWAVTV